MGRLFFSYLFLESICHNLASSNTIPLLLFNAGNYVKPEEASLTLYFDENLSEDKRGLAKKIFKPVAQKR